MNGKHINFSQTHNVSTKYVGPVLYTRPTIYNESIKPLSVLYSGLKCEWQLILTPPKNSKNKIKNIL